MKAVKHFYDITKVSFWLCTCLCLWWPNNTNRGRPIVGPALPHMSPMLTGLAEYPVVINVLLLSIPALSPPSLATHRDPPRRSRFTEDSGSGLLARERPARLSLEPTIGPSECQSQSVRVAQTTRTSLVTAETFVTSSSSSPLTSGTKGLNVSQSAM